MIARFHTHFLFVAGLSFARFLCESFLADADWIPFSIWALVCIIWRRWAASWSFYCLVGYMRFERDLLILDFGFQRVRLSSPAH